MKSVVAVAVACTLVFPAALSAQGSLQDSIAREATRAALSAGGVVQATAPPQEWKAVLALWRKAPVRVTSRDGRAISGRLISADAASVVIDKGRSGHETLARSDVREIRMGPLRATAGEIVIGAVSGLALGAVTGWGVCDCSDRARRIGLVAGGALGLAFGSMVVVKMAAEAHFVPGELVYYAPQSTITP